MLLFTSENSKQDNHNGKNMVWWSMFELQANYKSKWLYENWICFSWKYIWFDWKSWVFLTSTRW